MLTRNSATPNEIQKNYAIRPQEDACAKAAGDTQASMALGETLGPALSGVFTDAGAFGP